MLTKFWNFNQNLELPPKFGIATKIWNFNQIIEVKKINLPKLSLFQHKFQNHLKNYFTFSMLPQILEREVRGNVSYLYDPEVGMLLRPFALKGNNDLIWTLPFNYDQARKLRSPPTDPPINLDVKWRATSAAKKWKHAMANFTLTDQKSIIFCSQFEAIWAKHNTQWQLNKWKIITFVWRIQI